MIKLGGEPGGDAKVLDVQHQDPRRLHIRDACDFPNVHAQKIEYFFESHNSFEAGRFVKFEGLDDAAAANRTLQGSSAGLETNGH